MGCCLLILVCYFIAHEHWQWACTGTAAAHSRLLLGLCMDEPPSGTALEYALLGIDKKECKTIYSAVLCGLFCHDGTICVSGTLQRNGCSQDWKINLKRIGRKSFSFPPAAILWLFLCILLLFFSVFSISWLSVSSLSLIDDCPPSWDWVHISCWVPQSPDALEVSVRRPPTHSGNASRSLRCRQAAPPVPR